MFRKLRNKFLIFNMIMISATIIIAFLTVYVTTYKNTSRENKEKLDSAQSAKVNFFKTNTSQEDHYNIAAEADETSIIQQNILFPNDSLYFSLTVNSKGEVKEGFSPYINFKNDIYEEAKNKALKEKLDYSIIKLDNKSWMYKIIEEESNYKIIFLDVTNSQDLIFGLLSTFLLVGFIMLIIIFFISLYSSNKSIKPVSDAFERQKQFITNASHELKTPLSIINANYDVLIANKEETIESQMKWLDYMKIGTNRMSKLINNLLLLAKAENINKEIEKSVFNLTKLIEEIINFMEVNAKEKNISVIQNIGENINVKSNKDMLREVFIIFYENAIKYTDLNGKIEVNLYKTNQGIKCSIKNTTNNISSEDIPYLFDRFYRADKSRKDDNGSYGLGLSIAKTTINNLNGKVSVSYINGWIKFSFYIPS